MKTRNPYAKSLQQKKYKSQVLPGKKHDRTKHSSDFMTHCPLCLGDGLAKCPECGGTGEVEMWR